MAKPVLVVNYCIDGLNMEAIVNNLKSIQNVIENSGANEEYYTFVLPVKGDSNVQVFYDKDLNETSYYDLKISIEEKYKELKDNYKSNKKVTPLYPAQKEKSILQRIIQNIFK
ncbi:MAG: hypothetical protein ACOC1K_02145 [Nanoarchaeota archaeon]